MLPNGNEKKLDPRVRRTRQLLEQAFLELLGERDFQSISVQEVTQRAQVNRATFYAHFEDKYDLLDYSIRESFQQEIRSRLLNSCQFSLDNLRQLILAVCEYLDKLSARCAPVQRQFEALVEMQVRSQIHALLLAWLSRPDGDGAGRPASPEAAATAASWAIYGLAYQRNRERQKAQAAEAFADEVLPLVAANLGQAVRAS